MASIISALLAVFTIFAISETSTKHPQQFGNSYHKDTAKVNAKKSNKKDAKNESRNASMVPRSLLKVYPEELTYYSNINLNQACNNNCNTAAAATTSYTTTVSTIYKNEFYSPFRFAIAVSAASGVLDCLEYTAGDYFEVLDVSDCVSRVRRLDNGRTGIIDSFMNANGDSLGELRGYPTSISEVSSLRFSQFRDVDVLLLTTLGYGKVSGSVEIYKYRPGFYDEYPEILYRCQPSRPTMIWASATAKYSSKFAIGTSSGVIVRSDVHLLPDEPSAFYTPSDALALTFDDTANQVFCGCRDGSVALFDLRVQRGIDYRRPVTSKSKNPTIRHDVAVTCIQALNGGTRLLTSTFDGKLHFWDCRNASAPLLDFGDSTYCIQKRFVTDEMESVVFAAGNDGYLRSWSLRNGNLLMQKQVAEEKPSRSCIRLIGDEELWISTDGTLRDHLESEASVVRMDTTTVMSAPGKVLVAGGYLVLDRAYSGLVVATSSRFYCSIQPLSHSSRSSNNLIIVKSPQFLDGYWEYQVENGFNLRPISSNQKSNGYLEITVRYALAACSLLSKEYARILADGLDITIRGHNDFYSQREELSKRSLPLSYASLEQLPPFCPTHTTLSQVHKTGLGSSAAMIASLTGALLAHFKAVDMTSSSKPKDMTLIHNLAQLSHCLAQGKVGSGFDVSAAVRGSHSYKRFSPTVIDGIMEEHGKKSKASGEDAINVDELLSIINSTDKWDDVDVPFELPAGFRLMLADIDAGSSTPKLVSQVLAWRKAKPDEADSLWNELHSKNQQVEAGLRYMVELQKSGGMSYNWAISSCSRVPANEWDVLSKKAMAEEAIIIKALFDVYKSFQDVRHCLREMSRLANVAVEPLEQTRLLDACQSQPGVLMAGVPGAGGYDAIFCILVNDVSRDKVEAVWSSWKEMNVGPLLATASDGSMRLENTHI
ncbi:hypothetical protein SmJEL517_g00955 [Synchytrium microbalum]|uniref:phosphomevalonate kinase n=1 Tax=Synchytrium microbalum TaxID=1806994 RepID=A0A507CBT5_9FUNG|nr:uncharacterized protein SmJEL517_g00955 [Synchytrium microbalum]TPX36951.1 hypothetical protein SmJEL517_g00955 [Synchytrium microbalum]